MALAIFALGAPLGAWLGGRAIAQGFGYPATGYVGAALSALGLVVFAISYGLERRGSAVTSGLAVPGSGRSPP